ncbi:MAG: hypothetical protein PWQ79_2110 [Thermococcaceae archaeon]|uniref:class I SAM-dependent methyltransferase n=1 Tax=Thermococcus litoralis TaxID=2265 RepID=UPI001C4FB5C8|nr:class I SAM-dependent methyltransferase [Thermococcus litoralis]MDK2915195.1 hypothetical protein [Thermococcaceae archaeon]
MGVLRNVHKINKDKEMWGHYRRVTKMGNKGLLKRSIEIIKTEGIGTFAKKSTFYVYRKTVLPILVPVISYKLKKEVENIKDVEDVVRFTFTFKYLGFNIKPLQIFEEILELAKLVSGLEPKVVLEIGTANGGTLFFWSRLASDDATLISIDLPGGLFGGGYPLWKVPLYRSFAKPHQKMYLLRANSHDPTTLEKVKELLRGKQVDFLFIDGDHTYKGVKRDFEMYAPLVRKGGIIAFHDIVLHPPETGCEVNKFWNEIKHNFRHEEIVKDWDQKWAGIGVLYI